MGRSVRVDTASLIAGAVVVGNRGLGVLGSEVPSSGTNGPGYLYNDLSLPAEADDEFRGLVTTPPVGLDSFVVYEDSSFTASGPDGTYSFQYEGFKNGVSYGTATVTLGIGVTRDAAGALVAQAGTVTGAAARYRVYATAGALVAQAAAAAGAAGHRTLHQTSGALSAQSATLAGASARHHAGAGALAAQSAGIGGSATRLALHAASGSLAAASASVAGAAALELGTHETAGALAAAPSAVAGVATHITVHAAAGALTAGVAALAGDADHVAGGVHGTVGDLSAAAATVVGAAVRLGFHNAAGALIAQRATVAGLGVSSAEVINPSVEADIIAILRNNLLPVAP